MKYTAISRRIFCVALALALILGMSASGILNVNTSAAATEQTYVKVTEAPEDWSGTYLIVCEEGNTEYNAEQVVFDGSLTGLDVAATNYVTAHKPVTITNDTITGDYLGSTFEIAILDNSQEKENWTYTICSASGYYIGRSSGSGNSLQSNKTTKYANTISLFNNSIVIASSQGPVLQYNNAKNEQRFRYYANATQQPIQLYRLVEDPSIEKLSFASHSLMLEDRLEIRYYLDDSKINLSSATEVGYQIWDYSLGKAVPENQDHIILSGGFPTDAGGDDHYVSNGYIVAKDITKKYYIRAYAVVSSNYIYTDVEEYSVYVYQQLVQDKYNNGVTTIGNFNTKALLDTVTALIAYGDYAAAAFNNS